MNNCKLIKKDTHSFAIEGYLTFETVPQLVKQSQLLLESKQPSGLKLDCAHVAHCDSAGVALLIYWYQKLKKQQQSLEFLNLGEQMWAIVDICGLSKVISNGKE
jgi:phospholipid transport system transporter-binding protein